VNFQRLQRGFPNNPYFGHFWSLALEEQFYVMWPLLIFLLVSTEKWMLDSSLGYELNMLRAGAAHLGIHAHQSLGGRVDSAAIEKGVVVPILRVVFPAPEGWPVSSARAGFDRSRQRGLTPGWQVEMSKTG
jgi:hypothetical protein